MKPMEFALPAARPWRGPRRPIAAPHRVRRYRTIFISDVHLGTRGCKAELLADFLAHNDCQTLFLVGDIVDGWRLKESWYWPETHSQVLWAILAKVAEGTRVIYVPGNHDETFRSYCGLELAGVELHSEAIHRTAEGHDLLIVHGDHFDGIVRYARWVHKAGGLAYRLALVLNDTVNAVRKCMDLPYWSLSAYLKSKVKDAGLFIADFEEAAAREARERGVQGIVCGHIHHARIRHIEGTLYCNDGDWVESCTALTEDWRGRLEIVHWNGLAGETDAIPARRAPHTVREAVAV
jgi:UDP-2,3-diacylglucosamine pyrophosphatase LpxH